MDQVYNPDDPLEQAFLGALALGESGGASNSATLGVGGTDLSSFINSGAVDRYGFPLWQGQGNSHAAGTWQFEPSTWDSIASQYNLNFENPSDQAEGAWYLAQQTDPDLYSQLQSGDYSSIQSALKSVWPSVSGNAAAPQGLAADIGADVTTNTTAQAAQTAANNSSGSQSGSQNTTSANNTFNIANPSTWIPSIEGTFAQISLIVIGAVIIFVALWMLLSSTGAVPGPKEVGKSILAIGE